MGESTRPNDLEDALKPFYARASEAEERLSRLEAALASNKDNEKEDLLKIVGELESKLEETKSRQLSERQKASEEIQRLTTQNAKLEYRITHLVRALKDTDCKLGN